MTPIQQPRNDTKLLLGVAGFVVAGAAGIALLAGLGSARESESRSNPERPATRAVQSARPTPRPEPISAMPASLVTHADVEPAATVPVPAVAELEASAPFRIDPDANLVAEGLGAYAARRFDEAAAYFAAEAEARPGRSWTRYMLGLSLWKQGSLDEAADAMKRAAELDAESVKSRVNLARIQNDRMEFEQALEAVDEALALDPDDASARFLQGRTLRNLGHPDEAVGALTASLSLDPDNAFAWNLLGLTQIDLREPTAAIEALQKATELETGVAYMHNNLGMAYELEGAREEAIRSYRRAVECDETHANSTANLARLQPVPQVDEVGPEVELTVAEAATVHDETPQ